MSNISKRLQELNITLPQAPAKGGIYAPAKEFGGNLMYCSGCGSDIGDGKDLIGKLGAELTIEQGQRMAENCLLNLLALLKANIGDLDRIKSFVKMLAFVSSSNDFYNQPIVANGATKLLAEIFGEEIGLPTRSAIGVNVLPGNIPVEIELIVELKD